MTNKCRWKIRFGKPEGLRHIGGNDETYFFIGCKNDWYLLYSYSDKCNFCGHEIENVKNE